MDVRVRVRLSVPPAKKHLALMRGAAIELTNDRKSVEVSISPDKPNSMVAAFTIPQARQEDVVDKVMRKFSQCMEDYDDQTAWFPKTPRTRNGALDVHREPGEGRVRS